MVSRGDFDVGTCDIIQGGFGRSRWRFTRADARICGRRVGEFCHACRGLSGRAMRVRLGRAAIGDHLRLLEMS